MLEKGHTSITSIQVPCIFRSLAAKRTVRFSTCSCLLFVLFSRGGMCLLVLQVLNIKIVLNV